MTIIDAPTTSADKSEKPERARLSQLLPYLHEHRRSLAVLAALSVLDAATELVQPALVGAITGQAIAGQPVGGLVWLLVAFALVNVVFAASHQYLLQRTAHGVVRGVRVRLIRRMLRLPIPEYDRRTTGDLVARVGTDTTGLHLAVTGGTVEAVGSALIAIGAGVLAVLIDPWLFVLSVATFGVGAGFSVVAVRGVQALQRAEQDHVGLLTAATLRTLGAIRTVRSAGATEREADAIAEQADRAFDAGLATSRRAALVLPAASLGRYAALLVALTVGAVRIGSGQLQIGEFVAFLLYQTMMIGPIFQLIRSWTTLQRGLGALQRINEIDALPSESEAAPARRTDARAASERPDDRPLVRLDRVSFAYPGGDGAGLHEVSFDVPRGATVALVGPSGAGKSTVLALLERFYEPDAGSLRLDGTDLRDLPHDELRERIAYAEQDPAVLDGTLRSNVTLSRPGADDDEVRRSLAEVNLTDVAERSPEGLDVAVGERGVRLSGGERQRLTIARALLPNRELLLLDEPTAQLDPANEDQLRHAIRAQDGRTVIVAAHRLSTVMDADLIVVMADGRVEATGTHAELVASSPRYAAMARAQRLAP